VQSGGALRIGSRPGQGTTAEIWLPVGDATGEAPAPARLLATGHAELPERNQLDLPRLDKPLHPQSLAAALAPLLRDPSQPV
jgi:hypothetical protein